MAFACGTFSMEKLFYKLHRFFSGHYHLADGEDAPASETES